MGAGVDEIEIRSAIYNYMHKDLRWTETEQGNIPGGTSRAAEAIKQKGSVI